MDYLEGMAYKFNDYLTHGPLRVMAMILNVSFAI